MLSITKTGLNVQRRQLSKLSSSSILQIRSAVRFQSTTPTPQSTSSSQEGQSATPPPPPPPKSKHKLVYREIWPPLIKVLAYASATYFSLQLIWQYLDGEEQRKLEMDVRKQLEEEIRNEMKKKAEQSQQQATVIEQKAKGWFSWLIGK